MKNIYTLLKRISLFFAFLLVTNISWAANTNLGTGLCFDAIVDCDDNAGTEAAFGEMFVHIANVQNADGANPITFTSTTGTVSGSIAAGASTGTIQITGLSAADFRQPHHLNSR